VPAAASKPLWNWQEFSLPESSLRKCARIALTQDTVRPVRGAVIVEVEIDENGVIGERFAANKSLCNDLFTYNVTELQIHPLLRGLARGLRTAD
jgi:hypothetical protein